MEALKNYAIYLDGNLVDVTMSDEYLEKCMKELKEKHPDSKVSYGVWYD